MSSAILWMGILGPSDDDADRSVVLCSWLSPAQNIQAANWDSKIVASLTKNPFSPEDETRVATVNSAVKAVELKPKGSTVSFAAVGEDELELDELLQAFAVCCAKVLDVDLPKAITKASVRSHQAKLSALVDDMVNQGRIEHMQGDVANKQMKILQATTTTTKAS